MADHFIHHHIEYGGRQWFPLCYTSLPAEGYSVVPPCPRHHLKLHPVPAEEAEGPGPHAISLQDVQSHGPVQGNVCLVQVQKDFVEDRFPHGHNLLKQFDLEIFGPCAASHPEPMEGIMVGDGGGEAVIHLSPPSTPPPRDLYRGSPLPLFGLD